ncbi:MAG: tRNA (adenosine(37)-N6)-threonylcarbamoyltransferase complex dimerization subunit type 1 TsaB [Bryobacterales bacterium]
MLILALDTTSRKGSLALARDGVILESLSVDAPDGFGQIIFQHIDALLKRHAVTLAGIDCYAAASGPGSFTGIRVGLTAVKAFAEVHHKPVVAVSNLLALASLAEGRYRAPVLDARRGEVFAAVYDEQLRAVVEEAAVAWPAFLHSIEGREVTAIGLDSGIFEPGGAAEAPAGPASPMRFLSAAQPLAAAIARIAAERHARGETLLPDTVDANYVRRTDAELKWKDPA